MITITINVSEPVYREFQKYASAHDRSASELIREAMEAYLEQRLKRRTTLQDLKPLSLGGILKDFTTRGDLLEEMQDDHRH
jgi:Arc/MetJ-type ribon-helix-helix transcriptional regulator